MTNKRTIKVFFYNIYIYIYIYSALAVRLPASLPVCQSFCLCVRMQQRQRFRLFCCGDKLSQARIDRSWFVCVQCMWSIIQHSDAIWKNYFICFERYDMYGSYNIVTRLVTVIVTSVSWLYVCTSFFLRIGNSLTIHVESSKQH